MNARVVAVKRQERRRDRRRPVVIQSALGSWNALVTDISSGGIGGAIDISQGEDVSLEIGQRIQLVMPDTAQGSLTFTLEVTRAPQADLRFGARFVDIDEAQYRLIESYVTGRRRT